MKRHNTCLPVTALILGAFAIPAAAQQPALVQIPVTMSFSGSAGASAINLKYPNTSTGDQDLAGKGALGPFTFRMVRASANSPQPSSSCSGIFIPSVAGGGLFRFKDGSVLKVNLIQGGDCIDPVHMVANCTLIFQIAGGTGGFQGASGVLTLTETALPVLADATNHPVFFAETGEITGTVSGVAMEDDAQDVRR